MNSFTKYMGGALVFSLCLALSVGANDEQRPAGEEPKTEKEFLSMALTADMHEVKLGEIAVKQAESAEVKRFAQRMIDDHTKSRDALMEIAREQRVAVAAEFAKEKEQKREQLAKLEGTQFDREYMRHMVEGHEKAVKLYEKWAGEATDENLREHARRTLPIVKDHLEQARRISRDLQE